jgi:lysophospholipase L1-like esterase
MNDLKSEEIAMFKAEALNKEKENFEVELDSKKAFDESKKIVAEGDSWFDYRIGPDIIDCLRRFHGYSITNFASIGDTLENMIYGTKYNRNYRRDKVTITEVLRRIGKLKPKIFLFSGGGNDIAGSEFESYLNHVESGLPPLRVDYLDYMINTVFRKYLKDLIQKVNSRSPNTKIVIHGYGYTVPTGIGAKRFLITWKGPWMLPALARKGIFDAVVQCKIVKTIIDKYNQMLSDLDNEYDCFKHVNLCGIIDMDNDWENELHLNPAAYATVADKINEEIKEILKIEE